MEFQLALADLFLHNHLISLRKTICTPNVNASERCRDPPNAILRVANTECDVFKMKETPKLIHEILPVGMLQCNCHIVGDPITREAIVIDPGDDVEHDPRSNRAPRTESSNILITHSHIDHIIGLKKMREATGAPVLMHQADLDLYQQMETQAEWIHWPTPELAES